MKLKGAVIKHSHFRIITPEVMKELVLSKKPGAVSKVATMPQMTFDYRLGYGEESMTTRYFKKIVQFHEKDVKGKFSWDDYRGYPDGFKAVSYTHLTLPTIHVECRSRWSPYH